MFTKDTETTKIYLRDIINPDNIEKNGYNTDYGNRKSAISYIDGGLFEGETHKDTVVSYLEECNMDTECIDHTQGSVTIEEQEDIELSMAFGSFIQGTDNNDYVVIYPNSLFYVSMDILIMELKNKYPKAIICYDNNDRYDFENQCNETYLEVV